MEPMKHIRIGKDISLRWAITTDGAAIPLQGRDLTLEMKSPIGKVIILPYRVDGNVITITYYGYEQTVVGEYSLTLWENKGKPGQNVVDAIRAFKLVRTSPEEEDFTGGDLQVESVDLGTANLEILSGGSSTTPGESPDLSALEGKVDANTASISKINAELDNVKQVQEGQNNSIAQISTAMQEIKNEQTEQNNRLADHEERLVYTEGDLLKVREEYNSIISELIKSIGHTQKAFVVETNDSEGYINIDGVKKIIPANSIKGFIFQRGFNNPNPGIASFRFLVTDTSGITDMSRMFNGCSSLTSLDVTNFDTSAVTNMSEMFHRCRSLTSLDLSSFDTSAVTDMSAMFSECSALTSIDLSNFDTHAVTNMNFMFDSCLSLTSLDLSGLDVSGVKNISYMFRDCRSLAYLDLSNLNFSSIEIMYYTFFNCLSLVSLDLSNFDTSAVISIVYPFLACNSLISLLLGPNFFKTSAVTNIDFSSCSKWTNETVVTSLVTNSYDRAAAGLNTLTLKLHAKTKAALTDEQKATITSKGYTIA